MTWLLLGGGIAALLALAGIAWSLRRRRDGRIDTPQEAADAADAVLHGFAAQGAVVGADGAAALAVSDDGRVAVMKPHRGGIAACEVAWRAIRSTANGIVVDTGDRRFGTVALAGVDALDIRRLSPEGTGWRQR